MDNTEKAVNSTITVNTEVLANIYNLLHSIEIKGEAVDKVAYVKQTILQLLTPAKEENIAAGE